MITNIKELKTIKCYGIGDWHKARKLSGTRSSAICGENSYMTNIDAWEIITHKKEEKDLSANENVQFGFDAEEHIRSLFRLEAQNDYEVIEPTTIEKDGYRTIYVHAEKDYLTVSTDGLVIRKSDGEVGALEVKTANILSARHREDWKDGIPQNYYIQVLHEILVLGVSYAILVAYLRYSEYSIIKVYQINRSDKEDELKQLYDKEVEFYEDYVMTGIKPPLLIKI